MLPIKRYSRGRHNIPLDLRITGNTNLSRAGHYKKELQVQVKAIDPFLNGCVRASSDSLIRVKYMSALKFIIKQRHWLIACAALSLLCLHVGDIRKLVSSVK